MTAPRDRHVCRPGTSADYCEDCGREYQPSLALGAARERCEAALPEGWSIGDGHPWRDADYRGHPVWRAAAGPAGGFGEGVNASTSAAALEALAERLEARP
jgi:hypothetical protein